MSDRRKFISLSLLGSAAFLWGNKSWAKSLPLTKPANAPQPIVISTWDFGKVANEAAWNVLAAGGKALDAVEAGVKIPEADPENQSVGYGGRPDRDGRVTLDACIMDELHRCGAVMSLEYIMHPISVARMVMERTPHVALVGDGALQFALANGFKKENLLTDKSKKEWEAWLKKSDYKPMMNIENKSFGKDMPAGKDNHDTIGMLAMDKQGDLSGACTTSGMAYKMHGRIGDSPIIGAGLFVDNEIGAATSTGVGEEVIRIAGSHLVVELMRQGMSPQMACKEAVLRIEKKSPNNLKDTQVGFLAINKYGEHGGFALQKGFTYAVTAASGAQIIQASSLR